MSSANHEEELAGRMGDRHEERPLSFRWIVIWVLVSGACYYLATQVAWALCFPDSKVSLFFPPHAVLISVLLLVPTRHWWAYTLAALSFHFWATQQADWPPLYALHCEAFDAVQNVATAAGLRLFIKSPLQSITLRDAVVFVLIAVVIVPFGTAFWGAAFTVSNGYGTYYWIEWRNLGISNAVTAIVLIPGILLGLRYLSTKRAGFTPGRLLEAVLLGAAILTAGEFIFGHLSAGPHTSPALLYVPIPFLIWAAFRFGLGGTSAAVLLVTCQAIWGTMHGHGPFLTQAPAENALALQSFLLVISLPLLLLALGVKEGRRTQTALFESEERYREVVESQTDLVCRHLADSTLTFVNDAYCRFLGRRREELLGQKLLEFIPFHPRDAFVKQMTNLNRAEGGSTQEIELSLPDKRPAWYQWTTYPVKGTDGKVVEFQAIGHDISDRKRAEEARQILAHAARVSTVGALAGSLAHELNQPLAAILNNAQAGTRFLAGPTPDLAEIREVFHDIEQDTKRASAVIRQLRVLVKKEDLQFAALDLNQAIQDVSRLLHSDAVIRQVQIVLDCQRDLQPVRGDGVQLQQVILNLLLNAFEAMKNVPDSGRMVRVRTHATAVDLIQVEVSDCGTGIHPDRLAKLFEPFQSTKQDGLGLGLAISRSIVEAHGGRLWGINNPDRGATFCLTVPIHPVPANAA